MFFEEFFQGFDLDLLTWGYINHIIYYKDNRKKQIPSELVDLCSKYLLVPEIKYVNFISCRDVTKLI